MSSAKISHTFIKQKLLARTYNKVKHQTGIVWKRPMVLNSLARKLERLWNPAAAQERVLKALNEVRYQARSHDTLGLINTLKERLKNSGTDGKPSSVPRNFARAKNYRRRGGNRERASG